jgi:hypothetical protein
VVVLEGSWESPTEKRRLELTSTKSDLATALLDLAKGLRSLISGVKPDRVVIRKADVGQASRKEGPKLRLLAEGALAAAAREELDDVQVLTGKELADRSPAKSKPELDKLGTELGQASHGEAAGAALAALSF